MKGITGWLTGALFLLGFTLHKAIQRMVLMVIKDRSCIRKTLKSRDRSEGRIG